jgi:hypothetical protein
MVVHCEFKLLDKSTPDISWIIFCGISQFLFIYLFHDYWFCGAVARRHSCARSILNYSFHAAHQTAGSL